MCFRFAQLERLLLALFALSEEQRAALRARLKEFQRRGLLTSSTTHRGWGDYSVETLLQLILIFELIDSGCSPATARRMVETHWTDLRMHWAYAWRHCQARAAGETPMPYLWAILPHRLQEIAGGDLDGVPVADRAGEADLATITGWASDGPLARERHVLLINFPLLVEACREALARVAPNHEAFFCAGLEAVASGRQDDPVHRPDRTSEAERPGIGGRPLAVRSA